MNLGKLKKMIDGDEDIDQELVDKLVEVHESADIIANNVKDFTELEDLVKERVKIGALEYVEPSKEDREQANERFELKIEEIKKEDEINKKIAELLNYECDYIIAKDNLLDKLDILSKIDDNTIKEKITEIKNKHFKN